MRGLRRLGGMAIAITALAATVAGSIMLGQRAGPSGPVAAPSRACRVATAPATATRSARVTRRATATRRLAQTAIVTPVFVTPIGRRRGRAVRVTARATVSRSAAATVSVKASRAARSRGRACATSPSHDSAVHAASAQAARLAHAGAARRARLLALAAARRRAAYRALIAARDAAEARVDAATPPDAALLRARAAARARTIVGRQPGAGR